MINAFDHIHIYARDPERTMSFYQRHFGAERIGRLPTANGDANHFLILGGQFIVVARFPAEVEPGEPDGDGATGTRSTFGVAHIGFNAERLEPLVADLEAAGVRVHGPPVQAGVIRYVYCDAPDGVTIELTEYAVPARLRPALAMLRGFNRGVHLAKRAIGKQLLSAVA